MLLSVAASGRDWLCDVGFGGGGPWEPLPLEPSGEIVQGGWRFRVVAAGPRARPAERGSVGLARSLRLHARAAAPAPTTTVANYHTSTHPDSTFTKIAVVQRTWAAGALMLRGEVLATVVPGEAPVETPAPAGDGLLALLRERFGLAFPDGTRFRPLASGG